MALQRNLLTLQFKLGQGNFGKGGADTVELEGLRCSVNVRRAGMYGMAEAEIRAWGMPLDVMNKLTVLNKLIDGEQRFNSVVVKAGSEDNGLAVCFEGTISEAWADGRNAPDVVFQVLAYGGLVERINPIPPTSYTGSVDVETALAGIATQMGLAIDNNGVTGRISDPYWPGDAGEQVRKICKALDCNADLDFTNKVLAIWPKGGTRGGAAIEINAETGMLGYPAFTQAGVKITTLYNPTISYGSKIRVKSQFTPANGEWSIIGVSHSLESNVPGGAWFSELEASFISRKA